MVISTKRHIIFGILQNRIDKHPRLRRKRNKGMPRGTPEAGRGSKQGSFRETGEMIQIIKQMLSKLNIGKGDR